MRFPGAENLDKAGAIVYNTVIDCRRIDKDGRRLSFCRMIIQGSRNIVLSVLIRQVKLDRNGNVERVQ